jgi:asparagine synthase (glutamine-hydrolysing)
MSGFVGILNLDGAPVDSALLGRLTNFLSRRGPDAQRAWAQGSIGFGHTLLRNAVESAHEQQPLTLDGNIWIVADARIDGRRDLISALGPRDRGLDGVPDVELILRAYQAWGDACVDRLIGDFAFAIWDGQRRRLFCARDHFGMRLFFYARVGHSLIFSNTLDCLRLHPGVSDRLNDLAIADFLVFDNNQDLGTSAFADILRLPPAHTLTCASENFDIRRYWTLPEVEPVEYRRPQDCLDRFREVFDTAVSDRLRDRSAAILLSGGLDSPTVAASAVRVLRQRNSAFDFRAYTHYHETLIPHEERHYAGLVAQALKIPIQFVDGDNCEIFDTYDDPQYRTPEPNHFPMGFRKCDPMQEIVGWSRTVLTGFGGDPALASLLSAHFSRLLQARRFGRLVSDVASYLSVPGRLARLYVRTRLRRWFGPKMTAPFPIPEWLNPELVKRLALRERWQMISAGSAPNLSARPEAYQNVASPYWTLNFELHDCGIADVNVEACHPFFDLRVLKFLLALAALPWCSDKEILRRDGSGVLPDAVRLRKKSPLAQDPIWALFQKSESAWVDRFEAVPELSQFVKRDRVPQLYQIASSGDAWVHSKPLSLNFWLQRCSLYDPRTPDHANAESSKLMSQSA